MRWKQFYASGYEEILQKDFPQKTLWKFLESGILEDNNQHDALVYFGRRISRKELVEQVHLWARVIKGMGLDEGDEVLLFGPSFPEFIYIMLAADMTGITANLPNLMVKPEALESMVGKSRVAFVFDGLEKPIRKTLQNPQFEHVVILSATPLLGLLKFGLRFKAKYLTADAAIRRFGKYEGPLETEPVKGKAAYIFCSSGTSGQGYAKQIGMSDEAMIAMCRNALAFNLKGDPCPQEGRSYCQLPPFVCTGFFVLVMAPLYRGMTVYLDPRMSARRFATNILTIRPQITLATGANWVYLTNQLDRLIQKGKRPDLSCFTFPVMGGEGCTPEALRHINEVMEACGSRVALTSGYGLTETFSVSTVDYEPTGFDKDYSRPAVCVGYPFPGTLVGIFDENGNELGYEERGEIWVKTQALTLGYVNAPQLNQERFRDGWLRTKDFGQMDRSGKVFVYGRMDQYVMTNSGEKVYLFDIANRLREDIAVKDALVCQLAAPGSPLVAHLVLENNHSETQKEILCRLDGILQDFLPAGLRIEGYHLEPEQLKINIVGKIDRNYYSHLLTGYFDKEQNAIAFTQAK